MLADPVSQSAYLIIDALDECIADLDLLLSLVVRESTAAVSHAKWLISSRNWPIIKEQLDKPSLRLCLELNAESISAAVSTFIRYKVDQLAMRKEYNEDTQNKVQSYLLTNANDTFLWVALVCQDLASILPWEGSRQPNRLSAWS